MIIAKSITNEEKNITIARPCLSEDLPAIKRINKELMVKQVKNKPLLVIPKAALRSGARVITAPNGNDNKNMMIAGFRAVFSKIYVFFIRNILKENFCGLAKVSLMLYKIITEPKAKKADTKNIVLNEYCVT